MEVSVWRYRSSSSSSSSSSRFSTSLVSIGVGTNDFADANMPTYNQNVRLGLRNHTNILPDLIDIMQEYLAFSGVERLTLIGHAYLVSVVGVFSNGNICSSSLDKSIKIWNGVTGQCIQTITG